MIIGGSPRYESDLDFWRDQYLHVHKMAYEYERAWRQVAEELERLKKSLEPIDLDDL